MSHAGVSPRSTAALLVAAAVALLAGGVPSAAQAKKKGKPKPHLVLVSSKVTAPRYAFRGDTADLNLRYVIKNTGKATAPKTRTALLLWRAGLGGIVGINTLTPHLAPGKSFHGRAHKDLAVLAHTSLGAYRLKVCADYDHDTPKPRPPCVKKSRFYIAEQEWAGQISGVGPVAGASRGEKWQAPASLLEFSRYRGAGVFEYDFTGTVTWNDHGINNGGCLWQGSGSLDVDRNNSGPGITLDYLNGFYKGKETLQDRFYTLTASGGGGFPCHGSQPGPAQKTFLSIPKRRLKFGHPDLNGQFGSAFAEDTQWKWNYK